MQFDFTIADTILPLLHKAGSFRDGRAYRRADMRAPLALVNADLPTLFAYTAKADQLPRPARNRPRLETQAAILLQSVRTATPWDEAWIAFWRDHFSVYGYDQNVGAFLPHWEREVIRAHAFGNFSDMLNASAMHPCMLYYLNNRSSRAGGANENYARELFELHTLGREAYLNNLYARWREVPGATQGKPDGYIDQDVYEAARAFTGWTLEDGTSLGGGQSLPETGEFVYVESWHDNDQKRVLGIEFDPYAGPMKDGRRVLAMCAAHPATAVFLMRKLVKRMISDNPPEALVQGATRLFTAHRESPDQLRRIYKYLATESQRIAPEQRQKVRSPVRLVAAFTQAVGVPLTLSSGLMGAIDAAGPPVYGWPSPEGPPDTAAALLSSGYLRERWRLTQGLAENWWGSGEFDPFAGTSGDRSAGSVLARWEPALFGKPRTDLRVALLRSQGLSESAPLPDARSARRLVGWLACAPSFQTQVMLPAQALKVGEASI
jgi:uncharacterized protein (DUF1800 family)